MWDGAKTIIIFEKYGKEKTAKPFDLAVKSGASDLTRTGDLLITRQFIHFSIFSTLNYLYMKLFDYSQNTEISKHFLFYLFWRCIAVMNR